MQNTQNNNSGTVGQLIDYIKLVRLDRPIGIYLLLWPTLWALWLAADGIPPAWTLFVFICGVILMRSAGCAINDYADREIDGKITRTHDRPIPNGRITPAEALIVFALLSILAFSLVLTLNTITIFMSLIGALLAASYPFMKRYHFLPQIHLGIAFAWSIPMAYTAVTGALPPLTGWLLYLATVLWTTAYDTMYAMADREDDLKIGVKSSAILFGEADKFMTGIFQCLFFLCMLLLGRELDLSQEFYICLAIAAVFAVYQQFLLRLRDPQDCIRAFLNNNYIGFFIFLGIAWSSFPALIEGLR